MEADEVTTGAEEDLWSLGILPLLLLGGVFALLGVYWDIAWHIDIGRDTFFTLPHNFLYASILIVLAVSAYGLIRDRRSSPFHIPFRGLRLHPGVLMMAIAAALELAFAPMDDLWHRLFGADVALWAPMHLIGLLAMGVANFGGLVSAWIERELTPDEGRRALFSRVCLAYLVLLLAWSMLLLAEYEYSVMQFPMVFHPLVLAALPTFALVLAARLGIGAWTATWTALLFTSLRILLAGVLMFTASLDLAGLSRPMIPLLVLTALAIDLMVRRGAADWQIGAASAVLTVGANWVLVTLGNGLPWHFDRVAIALVPSLLLAVLLTKAAGWVATSLKGETAARSAGAGLIGERA